MRPYTVLLLRPDYIAEPYGQDTYMAHVFADFGLCVQELADVTVAAGSQVPVPAISQ